MKQQLLVLATLMIAFASVTTEAVAYDGLSAMMVEQAQKIYAQQDAFALAGTKHAPEYTMVSEISYLKRRHFYTASVVRTVDDYVCQIQITLNANTGTLISQNSTCN